MQIRKKRAIFAVIAFVAIAGSTSAYAQSTPELSDSQVTLVIFASVIAALIAPIIGYATAQPNEEPGKPPVYEKFNVRRYVLAVIIGIPGTLGLIMMELTTLNIEVVGLQGTVILFLMVFIQALGIDHSKQRISNAVSNP